MNQVRGVVEEKKVLVIAAATHRLHKLLGGYRRLICFGDQMQIFRVPSVVNILLAALLFVCLYLAYMIILLYERSVIRNIRHLLQAV